MSAAGALKMVLAEAVRIARGPREGGVSLGEKEKIGTEAREGSKGTKSGALAADNS
jgi:hypothetical protein